jgi:hypothetical protein
MSQALEGCVFRRATPAPKKQNQFVLARVGQNPHPPAPEGIRGFNPDTKPNQSAWPSGPGLFPRPPKQRAPLSPSVILSEVERSAVVFLVNRWSWHGTPCPILSRFSLRKGGIRQNSTSQALIEGARLQTRHSPQNTKSIPFPDTTAFELSRWRDGRYGVGFPRTLLAV